MNFKSIFFPFLLSALCLSSFAQTLPEGMPVLEDAARRNQILGAGDSATSFTIRPLYLTNAAAYGSLVNDLFPKKDSSSHLGQLQEGKTRILVLPATIRQQFNTHHPYGWNDGSMIPAKGYQTQISAGIYSSLGPLSVQLQPEFVFAQNLDFPTFMSAPHDAQPILAYYHLLNTTDNPEKYGNGHYAKLFPGQSSIRLNVHKLSLGISTENLWWGPGIRNALVMTNNAPGFPHISFNTTAPMRSFIGSFEGQLVSGTLKGSGILPSDTAITDNGSKLYSVKGSGDRYLNGMILTWQPKWTKGLFLGVTRMFYLYQSDLRHNLNGYLPVISKFFKDKLQNEDSLKRDQLFSLFFRWVLPKDRLEIYGEFGRNDHSADFRDLLQEPEHSRAYIFGMKKILTTPKHKDLELLMEFAQLQRPSTEIVRATPPWYVHHQVRHGYTQLGQVIGAGIGPGASSQTIGLKQFNGINSTGFSLERIVWNNDFYYDAFSTGNISFKNHWVDYSLNLTKTWAHKQLIYEAGLSLVRSLNYEWADNNDKNNIHATFTVSYLFNKLHR